MLIDKKYKKIISILIISLVAISILGYDFLNAASVENKEDNIIQNLLDQNKETPADEMAEESQPESKIELDEKTETTIFNVHWRTVNEEISFEKPIVTSKDTPFTQTIRISRNNIKSITFELTWDDDYTASFLNFGKDKLTFTIKNPDGVEIYNEKTTGKGNMKYTKDNINPKPSVNNITSENEYAALKQLFNYYNSSWKDEPIQIEISVEIGEIGIIRKLLDEGNNFDLKISYKYYIPYLYDMTRDSDGYDSDQASEPEEPNTPSNNEENDDNIPPTTTITDGPSGTIDYDDVAFTWTGSDDETSVGDISYSYMLDGEDSSWSSWTKSSSKNYFDLPNGQYTFRAKAKDNSGNIDNSPATRTFTVEIQIGPNRFATTVVELNFGEGHHASYIDPNMALGGPHGKGELMGSLNVLSLGKNGNITLGFDVTITDKQGMDFIVFENPFHLSAQQDQIYAELLYVEVSTDNVNFARFPSISNTPGPGMVYPDDVTNLAGVNPVYVHMDENDIDPFNPDTAGGDAFDLSDLSNHPMVQSGVVDLQNINYIRLIDIVGDGSNLDSNGDPIYDATDMLDNGADIDAISVINYT